MAWQFEYSARSPAAAGDVWRHYADVEHWNEWSKKGVAWSRLDGPFAVGTKGKSKPPGFPPGSFRLTAVEPDRMFASEAKLPGALLSFEHVIESVDTGVQITHRARLTGPMSWFWSALVRGPTERSLPDGVDRLAAMAAAG